jgi:ABC-type lipoprotein export system ATPase subunit
MAEPSKEAVVKVEHISKCFGSGSARVNALIDINLDVFPGQVVGLMGPSGSGKTTLLNCIACIMTPTGGQMTLDGEKVYDDHWLRADLRKLRLSGGEAQRVSIARALANHPRIILADEPTAPLDSQRSRIVMDMLRKVAVDQDAAIIVVTHDEMILDHFDHIYRLRDGRLDGEGADRPPDATVAPVPA